MKRIFFTGSILLLICFSLLGQESQLTTERQWPGYRGYLAGGSMDNVNLPESWDISNSENVLWKIGIPGLALSSPIIWDNRLFVTTAVSQADTSGLRTGIYGDGAPVDDRSQHDFRVYCIDKYSGDILWEKKAYSGVPEVRRHPKATHANCTPATDGRFVIAFFASEGLYCYDMEGNLRWSRSLGKLDAGAFNAEWAEWEFASSPFIYKNSVIVQCDVRGASFLASFNIETGEEQWRKKRDEYPGWSTPNIYTENGRDIIVVNGYKHRGAYDFNTGEEIWKMSGGGDVPIPTPVIGDGMIFFNSAHGKFSPIMAVKTDAKGDITLKEGESSGEYVAWSIPRGGSYMHTMLLYRGLLYNMKWNGQLSCYDPVTGEEIYSEKIGKAESFIASPVAADGNIYIISDQGIVYTVLAGRSFEILRENSLGGISMVVPAITDNIIFFRTQDQLIAISKVTR